MPARRDTLTTDLFDWQPPKVAAGYADEVAGRGALDSRIARVISHALKDAKDKRGLSRTAVAREISEYLGRNISEDMLNKWSSEAAGSNRITLDAFMALIEVTVAHDLLGFVVKSFGFVAVPERYGDIIQLHLLDEHERDLARERQAIEARLKVARR